MMKILLTVLLRQGADSSYFSDKSNVGQTMSYFLRRMDLSYFGLIFVLFCHTSVLFIEYVGGMGIFVL